MHEFSHGNIAVSLFNGENSKLLFTWSFLRTSLSDGNGTYIISGTVTISCSKPYFFLPSSVKTLAMRRQEVDVATSM